MSAGASPSRNCLPKAAAASSAAGAECRLGHDLSGQLLLRRTRVQGAGREPIEDRADLLDREVRRPFEVVRHEVVLDRHDLAEHLVRWLAQPDRGLWLRLAHALAVEALEQVRHVDVLRALADHRLQLATSEEVEELVGSASLDVGLDRDRVVRLKEGVEEILDRDRRARCLSLPEFLAGEHLLDGEARGELDHIAKPELPERTRSGTRRANPPSARCDGTARGTSWRSP